MDMIIDLPIKAAPFRKSILLSNAAMAAEVTLN